MCQCSYSNTYYKNQIGFHCRRSLFLAFWKIENNACNQDYLEVHWLDHIFEKETGNVDRMYAFCDPKTLVKLSLRVQNYMVHLSA